jgi:hypothetical protein
MRVLQVAVGSEQELQEIRAIEQAGHRRRRRWLNEKVRGAKQFLSIAACGRSSLPATAAVVLAPEAQ